MVETRESNDTNPTFNSSEKWWYYPTVPIHHYLTWLFLGFFIALVILSCLWPAFPAIASFLMWLTMESKPLTKRWHQRNERKK